MKNYNKKGFTLIEVIVVAILLSVLALGAFSLFMMYSETTRETSANMKMQRQSEALMDEIARNVRESNRIYRIGAPFSATGNSLIPDTITPDNGRGFILYDNTGDVISGFQFRDTTISGTATIIVQKYVKENNAELGWQNFSVDGAPIEVKDSTDVFFNAFVVGTNHVEIDVSTVMKTVINRRNYYLNVERGMFRCRL